MSLTGKRFVANVSDHEDDSEFGEVTHPAGSEFIVGEIVDAAEKGYAVKWQGIAVDKEGKEVPADGMWTIWTQQEIGRDARETAL